MRVMPGTYSPNEKRLSTASVVVDYEAAFQAGVSLHGSSDAMREYVEAMETRRFQAHSARVAGARKSGAVTRPFDGKVWKPFPICSHCPRPWVGRAVTRGGMGIPLCWVLEDVPASSSLQTQAHSCLVRRAPETSRRHI